MNIQENMLNRLWEVCPHSKNNIHAYSSITPDNISSAFDRMSVKIQWSKAENWESLTDLELFNKTVQLPKSGMLFISSDSNVTKPTYINVSAVGEFIKDYLASNEVCFFDGDIIIVSESRNYVYLFHHEGVFTNIESPI